MVGKIAANGLGSGGLVISDRCERLLWELGRYRNDSAAGPGEVRPLRKDNHAVDGLRYVNGSEVQFMSYDMDLGKFGGVDLDQVHFDEAPPEDIRTECFKRCVSGWS